MLQTNPRTPYFRTLPFRCQSCVQGNYRRGSKLLPHHRAQALPDSEAQPETLRDILLGEIKNLSTV